MRYLHCFHFLSLLLTGSCFNGLEMCCVRRPSDHSGTGSAWRNMKTTFIILAFLSTTLNHTHGNPLITLPDSNLFVQLDVAPRWIWRGVAYSQGPVIQPSLGYAGKKITAIIWGSYSILNGEYHELDFTLEYKPVEQINIGFTDYFGINDSTKLNQRFFNLKNSSTSHVFDFYARVCPFKNLPLSFYISNWFYGADKDPKTRKQYFSTYMEARYEKQYHDIGLYTFVGATPYKSFYIRQAGIVNLGLGLTKTYQIGKKLTLPLKVEFILNPSSQNVYVNAVVGIR